MSKELFSTLASKAKKSNEITRIKTQEVFSIHALSLTKNYTLFGGWCFSAKPLCPICAGNRVVLSYSPVSAMSLPEYTSCPVCDGSGCYDADCYYHGRFYNQHLEYYQVRLILDILWTKEAFKTKIDEPKFLPIVVLK